MNIFIIYFTHISGAQRLDVSCVTRLYMHNILWVICIALWNIIIEMERPNRNNKSIFSLWSIFVGVFFSPYIGSDIALMEQRP